MLFLCSLIRILILLKASPYSNDSNKMQSIQAVKAMAGKAMQYANLDDRPAKHTSKQNQNSRTN